MISRNIQEGVITLILLHIYFQIRDALLKKNVKLCPILMVEITNLHVFLVQITITDVSFATPQDRLWARELLHSHQWTTKSQYHIHIYGKFSHNRHVVLCLLCLDIKLFSASQQQFSIRSDVWDKRRYCNSFRCSESVVTVTTIPTVAHLRLHPHLNILSSWILPFAVMNGLGVPACLFGISSCHKRFQWRWPESRGSLPPPTLFLWQLCHSTTVDETRSCLQDIFFVLSLYLVRYIMVNTFTKVHTRLPRLLLQNVYIYLPAWLLWVAEFDSSL